MIGRLLWLIRVPRAPGRLSDLSQCEETGAFATLGRPQGGLLQVKRNRDFVGAHPVGDLPGRSSMRALAPDQLFFAAPGKVRQAASPQSRVPTSSVGALS